MVAAVMAFFAITIAVAIAAFEIGASGTFATALIMTILTISETFARVIA